MKVATRITTAAALVVTLSSLAYGYFDLRGRARERRGTFEREAMTMALATRSVIDAAPTGDAAYGQLARTFTHALGWRIDIVPRGAAPDVGTAPQQRRLRTMLEAPKITFAQEEGDRYLVAVPLRGSASASDETVAGLLEVSRSTATLDEAERRDLEHAVLLVALISLVTTLVVGLLARSFVSLPITKLLDGVAGVAKGDLSHVLLSERDDEIGSIATRFNEMTYSLRESRAETQRQNEAKLALEQRLSHTEKLATIGQLAAEIAHEVGTPLGVIAGRARATQRKAADPETVEKNASIIAEQTARITRIIQRLLDFARRRVGPPERSKVSLNQLALTTMELLTGQFTNAKIKSTLARAEGLPAVMGDPDRLQQVLLNLLVNAVQAMPDGGQLRVETTTVTRQRPGLELTPEEPFVCLEVSDTGTGIPADLRDKIFEPFYTSKDGQGGTGLGLAVCSGIVKEHDGWIDVGDGPTGGSVFRVFLPVAS